MVLWLVSVKSELTRPLREGSQHDPAQALSSGYWPRRSLGLFDEIPRVGYNK